ncbi:MAG: indole-3-glycerol phosphate synthase TrpC [Chloroflexi bacterium]|nr:indole-3-glycerol phosphate synthase TrpC [Chloroflexota bacterium]
MSILEEIFAHKRTEVEAAKRKVSEEALHQQAQEMTTPIDFLAVLRGVRNSREADGRKVCAPRLIAEVKHRSPSKGVLRQLFDHLEFAQIYAAHGASAISVLTDETYFGGSLDIMQQIANLDLGLPLLRKDFIFDRYQLLEARVFGASAVLLIAAMLGQEQLTDLVNAAADLELTALVEVHSREELLQALETKARLIGINNRDLHTFQVNLETTLQLIPLLPPDICLVSESGIHTPEDVKLLAEAGVDAILVGESLVRAENPPEQIRRLTQI